MSAAKKRPKKGRWIAIAAVAVVLIGGAAVWALRPAVQNYESVTAKTGTITTYYSFSGNIEARYRQTVISDKFMQIADVKVEEGDRVEEGDELFRTTAGERVKATINGEVANLDVEEDERVAAGVQLLEVIDYDALEVKVKVDEYDVDAIKKGEEATVFISATGKEVKGKVNDVSRAGEVADGVTFFTATIGLEKDETLRIGMSAEVRLIGDSVKDAVTLPMAALQFDADNKPYVYKADADGNPVKTEIVTGLNDGTTVEVKKGLATGDTVLYKKPAPTDPMGFRGFNQDQDSGGGLDG